MSILEHWQTKLEKRLREVVIADADLRQLIGAQFYAGELAGLKRKEYPLATFVVQGTSGNLDTYKGSVRIWAWSSKSEEEARRVFTQIDKILNNQKLDGDGLATVYTSRGDGVKSFNREFGLYLWTGLIDFKCINLIP